MRPAERPPATRRPAAAVLLALAAALGGARAVRAQAVERTDTPRAGTIRLTVDPRIAGWTSLFGPDGRQPIGYRLSSDSLGTSLPAFGAINQETRTASGISNFAASLGRTLVEVRAERRVTPIGLEVGITDRLSVGVMVPIVRVEARQTLRVDSAGGNLGLNPLYTNGPAAYTGFFTAFDTALAQLDRNIAGGSYGCPSSPQCTEAEALSAEGHSVRGALGALVFGTGASGGQTAFLPLAQSAAGAGIDSTVSRLETTLADSFSVTAFTGTLLLPTAPATASDVQAFLSDTAFGWGYGPIENTIKRDMFWLGDAEVSAKYRLFTGPRYAAAVTGVVRLPTGHQASPNDLYAVSTGDHQTDLEARFIQELTLWHRLWLNLNLRGGVQLQGITSRRIAPASAVLAPFFTYGPVAWKPGNYFQADFAPMWRFTPQFAAGFTVGYFTKRPDRYAFRSSADSTAMAARVGAPVSAAVLDGGTGWRWLDLGGAVTYAGPRWEMGFSVAETVSGAGAWVPAATTFRIVFRTWHGLF